MNNKKLYREHCRKEKSISLFSQDWWLDAVCGEDNWNASLVEKSGKIIGSMPYYIKKRMGFTILVQPPLTQTLGPWIYLSSAKYAKRLAHQKDVMVALIEQLPDFDFFSQNWNYCNTNWLPFYWKGFKQTTSYTYILPDLSDEKALWNSLEAKIKTDIRKASARFKLKVKEDYGIDAFLELSQMTFKRQGIAMPYPQSIVRQLDSVCAKRDCRKILIAEDEEGRHHAGAFIVWDHNSAYYLMGGGNPKLRNSGATSLVIWEAIRHAAKVSNCFDFEGSMVESIERFFRGFGPIQKPLYSISKINSRILHMRQCLMPMLKKL